MLIDQLHYRLEWGLAQRDRLPLAWGCGLRLVNLRDFISRWGSRRYSGGGRTCRAGAVRLLVGKLVVLAQRTGGGVGRGDGRLGGGVVLVLTCVANLPW